MKRNFFSYFKVLCTWLIIAGPVSSSALLCDDQSQNIAQHMSQNPTDPFVELNEQCIPITSTLSAIFDAITGAYAAKSIGTSLSKEQKIFIEPLFMQLRQVISSLESQAATYQSKQATILLLQQIAESINILETIIKHGIEKLFGKNPPKPHSRSIIITPENADSITIEQATKLFEELQKETTVLSKETESLGLTRINKMFRWGRGWWNRLHVGWTLGKIAHYGAIAALINLKFKSYKAEKSLPQSSSQQDLQQAADHATGQPETPAQQVNQPAINMVLPSNTAPSRMFGIKTIAKDQITIFDYPLGWLVPITLDTGLVWGLGAYLGNYAWQDVQHMWRNIKIFGEHLENKLFGVAAKVESGKTLDGSGITFKDIIGREEVKAELEKIIDYACNPGKYDRSGITPEKGYLFVGPSQNGKSAMVEALGNELANRLKEIGKTNSVMLKKISVDDILAGKNTFLTRIGYGTPPDMNNKDSSPIGLSNWVSYYKWMANDKPLILVIDELDMLKLQRDGDPRILADFLTTMSGGLSGSEKNMVIIIGLTNKPSSIDFALKEHGRFGKKLSFERPTYKDRLEFFEKAIKKRFMDPNKFSCKKLAHETEGVSYGTLLAVEKRAFFLAKQAGVATNQHHFEQAINTEVKNIIYSDQELPAEKVDIIATHQAGKALASMLLDPKRKLSKVTIRRYTREVEEESQTNAKGKSSFGKADQRLVINGGIFSYSYEDELDMAMQDDLIKQCKILLAGNVAQQVLSIKNKSFDKADKEAAFDIARKLALEGFDDRFEGLPKQIQEEMLTKAYTLIKTYEKEVAELLTNHKAELVALIQELKELKDLDRTEVAEVMYRATHPE